MVTNVNVQHLESLNDAVETLTGFAQRETVPDAFVASADRIDLLDVEPKVLRQRIADRVRLRIEPDEVTATADPPVYVLDRDDRQIRLGPVPRTVQTGSTGRSSK